MGHDYSETQLDNFLGLTGRIAALWTRSFPEKRLQSPAYWHLFMGLYKNRGREITKGEAGDFLTAAGIKSPATKAKVIAGAISMGYGSEEKSSVDNRVSIVRMTPVLQNKLREYLAGALRMTTEEVKLMNA
jgi:hypothetical protein